MLQKLDAWVKANPYVSKLVVAVLTAVAGWFSHKYLGVDVPPAPLEPKPAHKFGWKPASPEQRLAAHKETGGHSLLVAANLPAAFRISADTGPVLDQGDLGSCGPNSMSSMIRAVGFGDTASRLFTYYQTRNLMGTIREDSGVVNSQMARAVHNAGYVAESEWPYVIGKFRVKPSAKVVADAKKNKGAKFVQVATDVDHIKLALSQNVPVLIGFEVYESFESDDATRTGDIPMPGPDEQLLGGHDVVVVGWDDAKGRFTFKNSWGTGWGKKGYGTLPFDYVVSKGSDFWALVSR